MFRRSSTLATPETIRLSSSLAKGSTHFDGLVQESADRASDLLMINHAKFHTLFNEVGLHNHIVHHLCSIYALGASPSELQAAYELNEQYQLLQYDHDPAITRRMRNSQFFIDNLGETLNYVNYLHFFREEIANAGVEDVVQEYLFKGNELANNLLGRAYSGFEHPILHLGFALEFKQPCLVAESLASACVHETWPLDDLLEIENHIALHPELPLASMLSVVKALKSESRIAAAAKRGNPLNRVTDALLKHAAPVLTPILARWRVQPTQEDIDYRLAEMTNICAYLSGAAQHPTKEVCIDFFMMHSTNLSDFYPVFMGLDWLSLEQKARLLTWKGWMDLIMYAACACPDLHYHRIVEYEPKMPGPWEHVVARVNKYPDDGHTAKLVRALINAENTCTLYSEKSDFPLVKEDFLQIAHMAIDSVERMLEPDYEVPERIKKLYIERLGMNEEAARIVCRFVRWCGIDGAYDDVPDLIVEGKARL